MGECTRSTSPPSGSTDWEDDAWLLDSLAWAGDVLLVRTRGGVGGAAVREPEEDVDEECSRARGTSFADDIT